MTQEHQTTPPDTGSEKPPAFERIKDVLDYIQEKKLSLNGEKAAMIITNAIKDNPSLRR